MPMNRIPRQVEDRQIWWWQKGTRPRAMCRRSINAICCHDFVIKWIKEIYFIVFQCKNYVMCTEKHVAVLQMRYGSQYTALLSDCYNLIYCVYRTYYQIQISAISCHRYVELHESTTPNVNGASTREVWVQIQSRQNIPFKVYYMLIACAEVEYVHVHWSVIFIVMTQKDGMWIICVCSQFLNFDVVTSFLKRYDWFKTFQASSKQRTF